MIKHALRAALMLAAVSAVAVPALADDCSSAARSAMLNSGHTPVSTTSTITDSNGKKSTSRTIQTTTNKYVQTKEGKWYSMNIAIKELTDNISEKKVTCHSTGSELINGVAAVTYEVQVDGEFMKDNKIWVSSKNLILRSDYNSKTGSHFSTVYDYDHVTPPANAVEMGSR